MNAFVLPGRKARHRLLAEGRTRCGLHAPQMQLVEDDRAVTCKRCLGADTLRIQQKSSSAPVARALLDQYRKPETRYERLVSADALCRLVDNGGAWPSGVSPEEERVIRRDAATFSLMEDD